MVHVGGGFVRGVEGEPEAERGSVTPTGSDKLLRFLGKDLVGVFAPVAPLSTVIVEALGPDVLAHVGVPCVPPGRNVTVVIAVDVLADQSRFVVCPVEPGSHRVLLQPTFPEGPCTEAPAPDRVVV